jgi:hypothetical protein
MTQQQLRVFRTQFICIFGVILFLAMLISGWWFPLVFAEGIATIIAALWSGLRQS